MNPTGILLIDKAEGWTSHDVVARTRRAMNTKKVGHAGTLDPMATGLLVLGVGPSTRLLTYLVGLDKVYTATIRLGAETTTDDREGEITMAAPDERLAQVSDEGIRTEIGKLTGDIMQSPSAVSAIKVDGKRAYDRVRAGETVELKQRPVTIEAFDVDAITRSTVDAVAPFIDVVVRVHCSSGTYIRALARDLGRSLGVGGHLTALRRERVGPFSVSSAASVEDVSPASLIDPTKVATELFARLDLDAEQSADLRNGKKLALDRTDAEALAAVDPEGRLIGLVSVRKGKTKILVNFPVPSAAPSAQKEDAHD